MKKIYFLALGLMSLGQLALADAGDFAQYAGYYQLVNGNTKKCSDQFQLEVHERDNSLDFIIYSAQGSEEGTNSIDMDQEGKKILTNQGATAYYGIYHYTYTKFEQDGSRITWYRSYKQVDTIGDRDRSRSDWKKAAQISFTETTYRAVEGEMICNYKKVAELNKQ